MKWRPQWFSQWSYLQNFKKLPLRIFSDDTELMVRLKSVEHEDNILVVEVPKNANLLPKVPYVLACFPMFRDEFQCT